jgi:hypothetical protein
MRVLAPAFGKIEEVERINTSLADHGMNFSAEYRFCFIRKICLIDVLLQLQ